MGEIFMLSQKEERKSKGKMKQRKIRHGKEIKRRYEKKEEKINKERKNKRTNVKKKEKFDLNL